MTHVLAALHLLVDGLCACALFLMMPTTAHEMLWWVFLTYDILAFMTQPLTGLWMDCCRRKPLVLCLSMALLSMGAGLAFAQCDGWVSHASMAAACLLGLGNSLFHVYGGRQVAVASANDMRHLGWFVSTGALGLVLGQCFCSGVLLCGVWLALMTLTVCALRQERCSAACAVAGTVSAGTQVTEGRTPGPKPLASQALGWGALAMILFAVMARSFFGKAVPPPLTEGMGIVLLIGFLAMMGKAAGGYLAVRLGAAATFIGSLLLAGVCFLLSDFHDVWLCATVFLVNVSMPVTLFWSNRMMPRREGLSFGLLAAVLLPGYLLAKAFDDSALPYSMLNALVGTLVIECLVLLAQRERRWQVLAASAVMNVVTNLSLNLFIHTCSVSLWGLVALELLVFAIEAVAYYLVLHDVRRSLLYSGLCNATSLSLGLLVQVLV